MRGEITSKKSPRLIVTDDSGDTELYLAKGSGLSISAYEIGDQVEAQGVLLQDGANVRLMPRNNEDIKLLNNKAGPETSTTTANLVSDLNNQKRNNTKNFISYVILLGVAISAGIAWLIVKYKKNIMTLLKKTLSEKTIINKF